MPCRLCVALAFFFSLAQTSNALDPNKGLHQYNCQTWSRQHGLPSSGINAITQTEDGYIWLGGSSGLVRFDGLKFSLVPFPPDSKLTTTEILCLLPRKAGGLWAGTKLSGFGWHDRSWTLVSLPENPRISVPAMYELRDGRLLIGGDSRAIRGADGTMSPLFGAYSGQFIYSIIEDSSGRIWAACPNTGLQWYENGKWHLFPDSSLNSSHITALAEGNNGELWVGTSYSIARISKAGELISMEYPGAGTACLLKDRHGTIWAGTSGSGLLRFANDKWSSIRKPDGLADNAVLSLAEDREGSIWVGTRGGLSQLTDVKLPTFAFSEGLGADSAHGVSGSPRGGVWVSTALGASYFDGKRFSEYLGTNANLPSPYIKRVLEDRKGDLYLLGGGNEIWIARNGTMVARHPTPQMPVAMAEDAQGVLVSAGGELYRVGLDGLSLCTFTNQQAPKLYWTFNLTEGRDGSILASTVNGVFRIRDQGYEHWSEPDGLGDSNASHAIEDVDGTIWVALSKGIARIRGRTIRTIGRNDGLPDSNISTLMIDDRGTFWIDANRCIFSVSRQQLNDFADGKIPKVHCTAYDGLGSIKPADKYSQEQTVCRTKDGRIWFPGSRGAIMVDPSAIPTNSPTPIVHLEVIRANGEEMPPAGSLVVKPGRGELEFRFTGLSYIAPHSIQFRYKLEGHDVDWIDAQDRRIASYANLKPGSYRFVVTAANADGMWNPTPASVSLQLLPGFHQTRWFYVLCSGICLAALFGFYRWRIQHLRQRQKALQRARDELEIEVQRRTSELAEANASLRKEETLLKQKTLSLEQEIEHRTRMQREVERVHRELLLASRLAGMAEVATSVLHNVGNVLNSVNVAASMLQSRIQSSKISSVRRIATLLQQHTSDLGTFITSDPKGQQLPGYIHQLGENLAAEQALALDELAGLQKNIGHIKDIVAMQQSYAKVAGVTESVKVVELVEDAIRMNEGALIRHCVGLKRDYDTSIEEITVDRHKVIQILINLIRNAKYACDEGGSEDKQMILRIRNNGERVQISVEDNGVGIPAENLNRIFIHGFTTRKHGHGFGLHSGAIAAKEMGGSLQVHSDGPGKGACFTLELPSMPPSKPGNGHPTATAEAAVS